MFDGLKVRKSERHERNQEGCQQRAAINASRTGAQIPDQFLVRDLLFARIQIARPARGHGDSSLLPRLKESQTADPDGKEDYQARPARRAERDQDERQADTHRQGDDAHQATLSHFARAQINGCVLHLCL